ncbi:MAG: type II toxin-antitoxin system HipA family toxin [Thermodesulfobacteriota bacterium]|nr:type II toxin-antitoxin system HipA family toxin [Thermodesulfobacteriota bacterium]
MGPKSLNVWIDKGKTGILEQQLRQKYVFAYSPEAKNGVSLTMPIRLEGWVTPELHPVFQMNIPEGALLEAIRRAIAKIIGDDELSILAATGGNQIGRNRFTLPDQGSPPAEHAPESLDELLTYPDTEELFNELLKRYAIRSGISGVQPKVLLDANRRGTLTGDGYIVKSWGADYPCLAANEFFCMTAAKKAGLKVPDFYLADNGGLFIMRRFDRDSNGEALGFEDMCSLQALGSSQKYYGTYERVAKTLKNFISGEYLPEARRQFFATLILSSMVQNGDAHLKNFGVLYPDLDGPVSLAPVFDVVTTTAYLKNDVPALAIDGRKKWWPKKMLERYAMTHLFLPAGEIKEIISRMADAVMETRQAIPAYIVEHPEFKDVGERMIDCWAMGVQPFLNKNHV